MRCERTVADGFTRDENILKGIYQMRFTKPSKIQERALPLLLRNPPANMIGQSQSGTGKTAAFVLNMLSRIDLSQRGSPQALVLAPSRELARQILGVIQVMGQFMNGLEVDAAIPVDLANRKRMLTAPIIVGTPGTVMDLIRRRQLSPQNMRVLVLDEADNMLDQQGLGDQCHRVRQSVFLQDSTVTLLREDPQIPSSPDPDSTLFCNIPKPRCRIRSQICSRC